MKQAIKIIDPIQITVNNSYKLDDWLKNLILKCSDDNPNTNLEQVAKLIGISYRTLSRKAEEYKLDLSLTARRERFHASLNLKKVN